MSKGYWIVRVDVSDREAFGAYTSALGGIFTKYGANTLVRGGRFEAMEGTHRSINVLVEFADYATALACYRSPEYADAIALRTNSAAFDLIVVEGLSAAP